MTELEPISISPSPDQPRHPQQEIADLLAAALLRLRAHPGRNTIENSERVRMYRACRNCPRFKKDPTDAQ